MRGDGRVDTLHERLVRGICHGVKGARRNGARAELRRLLMLDRYPETESGWIKSMEELNYELAEDGDAVFTDVDEYKKHAAKGVSDELRNVFHKIPDAWVTYDVSETYGGSLRHVIYLFEVEVTHHLGKREMAEYQSLWWCFDSSCTLEVVLVTVDRRGYLSTVDIFADEMIAIDPSPERLDAHQLLMGIKPPGYWGDSHPRLPRKVLPIAPQAPEPKAAVPKHGAKPNASSHESNPSKNAPEEDWRTHIARRADARRDRNRR